MLIICGIYLKKSNKDYPKLPVKVNLKVTFKSVQSVGKDLMFTRINIVTI
jgi:hypothetical protein